MTCIEPIDSTSTDSAVYKDGSCMCSWGKVYWRNGVWVDEKGRDISSRYTYVNTEYYPDGKVRKQTTLNKELQKLFTKEWDETGKLISETAL